MSKNYTTEFYTTISSGSQDSARKIVPYIIDLIQPKSVVDIGCGTGYWLSAFQKYEIDDVLGIDGEYVDRTMLQIPVECFLSHDLTQPLNLNRRFDLAVSLEVAEHIPENKARQFIDSLVRHSDVVLFSVAIPYQPGAYHVNCQWIDYWAEIFDEKGFILVDCIRLKFWQNQKVNYFYSQNMFLAVKKAQIDKYPALHDIDCYKGNNPPSLVHPEIYLDNARNLPVKKALSLLIDSLSYRFRNIFKQPD
jgi:SAM-dependent methyltransferase